MRVLASVLRRPGVARVLFTSLLGRLPMTAAGLLFVLRARELGFGYATGGVVAGAYALGLAVSAPPLGRLIDRRGQTQVLVACAVATGGAYLVLALLGDGTPAVAVIGLGLAAGLANPPLSASARALFDDLLGDADGRHRVLALESAFMELLFVAGPLLFVTAIGAFSLAAAVAAAGACLLAGGLLFAALPASRARRPDVPAARSRAGALAAPAVRGLVGVMLLAGASFGAIEIACAAFAEDAGHRGATGLLLGLWGLGSGVGGLVAAHAGVPADRAARLRALLLLLAVLDLAPGVLVLTGALTPGATGLAALGALLLCAGVAIAPALALVSGMMGDLAPAGTQTEAYTWLGAGVMAGIALGSATGGAVIGAVGGAGGALAAGAVAAALAALAARTTAPAGAAAPVPAAATAP